MLASTAVPRKVLSNLLHNYLLLFHIQMLIIQISTMQKYRPSPSTVTSEQLLASSKPTNKNLNSEHHPC
jgi:hypothetical protein